MLSKRLCGFLVLPMLIFPGFLAPAKPHQPGGANGSSGKGSFADVAAAGSPDERRHTGVAFAPVAGLATAVEVPARTSTRVVATFIATPSCTGGVPGGRCLVRISVDGRAMGPAAGSDLVFDAVGRDGTPTAGAGNAIVRSLPEVGPGRHRVVVEAAASAGGGGEDASPPTLKLSDSSLIAQAVRQ